MEQQYINMALSISFLVLGWFAREMWSAVKELKSDLAKLREEIPHSCVQKDDYRQDIKELKDMISKLFDIIEKRR
jgi:cell division protein FtsL